MSNSTPVAEGTVIMAESQYAGRGQQQNQWHSEPGKNLTFSLLLKPSFLPVSQQFDLTRAVSLGICNALEPFLGEKLKIKWPNDIYYGNRKLGGMLIENTLQGGRLKNSIIGIGLNINQEVFPPGAANAVSLKQILHSDYDLKIILSEICKNIETNYLSLRSGRYDTVRKEYTRRLYRLNEEKIYRSGEEIFEGRIEGVTDEGLLRMNVGNDEKTFNLKEIEFLNN